jgi:hypothetical protein
MFGSLMTMACITIANMRKRVVLHHLILIEVSIPYTPTSSSTYSQAGDGLCASVTLGPIAVLYSAHGLPSLSSSSSLLRLESITFH